jgi:peptidyl-dipeptidase A
MRVLLSALAVGALFTGCASGNSTARPTAADAAAFLERVDERLLHLAVNLNQAGWVQQNFITVDTEAINARANKDFIEAVAQYARTPSGSRVSSCRPINGGSWTCCGCRW